jgi:hypothetical protein
MIYCPQCGSGMSETTRFCKSCGLPLAPLSTYIATGGTAPLTPIPPPVSQPGLADGLTPKQQLVLTILLIVMSPAIFGILGGALHAGHIFGWLVALSGMLIPLGVLWAVFRYKANERRLEQHAPPQLPPQAWQRPAFVPPPVAPVYQPPQLPQPQASPQPEAKSNRGSVVENETQRLPENRR